MPDDPRHAVAALRLGAWSTVASRVLPRLVPRSQAGPLARPLPTQVGPGRPRPAPFPGRVTGTDRALSWDVAIDVPGGIVRIDQGLLAAWHRSPVRIWDRALANLDALGDRSELRAGAGRAARSGQPSIRVLAGGPWTTGWLLGLDVEPRAAAVVVGPELVVVADHPNRSEDPTTGGTGTGDPGPALWSVARRLARADGLDPADQTLLVRGEAPFPGQWILE